MSRWEEDFRPNSRTSNPVTDNMSQSELNNHYAQNPEQQQQPQQSQQSQQQEDQPYYPELQTPQQYNNNPDTREYWDNYENNQNNQQQQQQEQRRQQQQEKQKQQEQQDQLAYEKRIQTAYLYKMKNARLGGYCLVKIGDKKQTVTVKRGIISKIDKSWWGTKYDVRLPDGTSVKVGTVYTENPSGGRRRISQKLCKKRKSRRSSQGKGKSRRSRGTFKC